MPGAAGREGDRRTIAATLMLGLFVVVGVIARYWTRARDRGKNRMAWVAIGIASYVVPYLLVHEVLGALLTLAFDTSDEEADGYFPLLVASIAVAIVCSVAVMRFMLRRVPRIGESG